MAYISLQCLRGLSYLHSKSFVHENVDSYCIKLFSDGQVKIDCKEARNSHHYQYHYVAPERYNDKEAPYSGKIDIWSLGILLHEMAELALPYSDAHGFYVFFLMKTKGIPPLSRANNLSVEFHDFYANCIAADPQLRASTDTLLEHPFLHKACSQKEFVLFLDDVMQKAQNHSRYSGYYNQNKYNNNNNNSTSSLDTILFSQNADGSWSYTDTLNIVVPGLLTIVQKVQKSDEIPAVTALVINYLVSTYSQDKEDWELIGAKALDYLLKLEKSNMLSAVRKL
jgi:serine/threonine protein kinase